MSKSGSNQVLQNSLQLLQEIKDQLNQTKTINPKKKINSELKNYSKQELTITKKESSKSLKKDNSWKKTQQKQLQLEIENVQPSQKNFNNKTVKMADELQQELQNNQKEFQHQCQSLEQKIKEALLEIENTEEAHFSPGFKQQQSPFMKSASNQKRLFSMTFDEEDIKSIKKKN